jgi:hypothetical protein
MVKGKKRRFIIQHGSSQEESKDALQATFEAQT